MLDIAAWIQRAKLFLRRMALLPGRIELDDGIEPPATDEGTLSWLHSAGCTLPPEVRRFISQGSNRCYFRYQWVPPAELLSKLQEIYPDCEMIVGGAEFCEAAKYLVFDNRDWFRGASLDQQLGTPESLASVAMDFDKQFQAHFNIYAGGSDELLQLAPGKSGRHVSLRLAPEEDDCYVVCGYKSNDRPPMKVSRTFEQFLIDWEQIGYISPSVMNLRPWLDPESGLLNPPVEILRQWKALFAHKRR